MNKRRIAGLAAGAAAVISFTAPAAMADSPGYGHSGHGSSGYSSGYGYGSSNYGFGNNVNVRCFSRWDYRAIHRYDRHHPRAFVVERRGLVCFVSLGNSHHHYYNH